MSTIQVVTSAWEKSYIYHSPPYRFVVTGNILVMITRFAATIFYLLQRHFHNWFSVLRHNPDLAKLEWAPLFFNFSKICQIDTNCSPFHSLNMFPSRIRLEHLKLIYYSLISIFFKHHFKTSTFSSFSYLHMHAPL